MDNKTLINAAISYAPMLGELFLLAKNNPNFNNSYVRNHAKNATKIHFSFLVLIIFYLYFIDGFLNIYIPIINLSIDNILQISMFGIFTFILIRGAFKAQAGVAAEELKINKDYLKLEAELLEHELSEAQKMLYMASFIPFIGLIISAKHPSQINKFGSKIGGIFSIIIIFFVISNHPDLLGMATLLYIGFVVTSGVFMFLHQKILFSSILESIPNLETSYVFLRSGLGYLVESIKVIFGKKENISFQEIFSKTTEKDIKFYEIANTHLTSSSIAFSNKLIYIPGINIIYIPKYFFDKKSKYSLAIIQGIIVTIILALIIYFKGSYSNYASILLFPIFLGIANIDSNPFYRIPVVYEIYLIFDSITFGLFSKLKFIKEKNEVSKEVSFKI